MQCLYYPPEVGGLESHVAGLAEGLARAGHQVTMLTSRSQPQLPRHEEVSGVSVHRVWMPGRSPLAWMAHIGATIPKHARLAREADVLHAHTFACGIPPMVEPKGRPFVLTLHTSHFLVRSERPIWRSVFRRVIRAADYLLTTSEEIRQVAETIYPHPRSEAITNAVDTRRFAPKRGVVTGGPKRIIVPRRLFAKNGVEYFVRAMPLILRELEVTAQIVGDGPEHNRLVELASELGVSERIEFLGARANQEMPALLCAAHVAVIPSLIEATSIAALEAMSCGLPVAASHVGGLPEIIDEEVGTLFQPGDAEALASAVVSLLGRVDLADLGREGRRRVVANWSLDSMVKHHVDIYSELMDEE
jgi:glycosyltransferase involved in cell wall biosynthesis